MTDIQKEILFKRLELEIRKNDTTLTENVVEPNVIKVDNIEVIDKPMNEVDCCLHCGSISIKKFGFTKGTIQRYRCKDCGKTFTANYGLITHYTHLSIWQWQEIIRSTIEGLSISQTSKIVKTSTATVWSCRLKIYNAIKSIYGYCDRFNNITEVDGKYERVSFKGTRNPAFFIETLGRLPRHHMSINDKYEYLRKHGYLDKYMKESPNLITELVYSNDKLNLYGQESNQFVCILTAIDRVNNLYLEPISVGKPKNNTIIEKLTGRIERDSVLITDKHQGYEQFATAEMVEHIQISAKTHISPNKAYSLGRINALHSQLDLFMKKEMLNMPATKYLDLYLFMFWWLQKNKSLSILEMHNRLSKILFGMVDNQTRAKMSSVPVLQLVDRPSPVDISKVFS